MGEFFHLTEDVIQWISELVDCTRCTESLVEGEGVSKMFAIFASTEHFLVLMTFLFPPVLITVALVVLLSSFGKSMGLRERYVGMLIRIFEVFIFN